MIRADDRLAILGHDSPLFATIMSQCAQSTLRHIRLISSWGTPHADWDEAASPPLERAVYSPGDFDGLRRAVKACNYLIYLSEPSGSITQGVTRMRQLAQACRDTEVERLVVVSCASILGRAPGRALADELALPTLSQATRWRYMVDLECARFAADAMDIVTLYPGLMWSPSMPGFRRAVTQAAPHTRVSLMEPSVFASLCFNVLERGRAGRRYALGMCNVTMGEVADYLAAHHNPVPRGTSSHARFNAPCASSCALDTSRARQELDLLPAPSFGAFVSSMQG